ncbi:MAG TPA: DUF2459 domain-containing protein [Acetobacteraceae bacterium]|nr:DUF2459 domain-containing protein [Acetobacteraceae bacterium]
MAGGATTRRRLLGGALAAPLAGGACAPLALTAAAPAGEIPVHVLVRDWHADVVFDIALLRPPLRDALLRSLPRSGHAAIGFGSREFLMNGDPDALSMIAAFLYTPGAVSVSQVDPPLAKAELLEDMAELRIGPAGLGALLRFVRDEIVHDTQGQPVPAGDAVYRRSRVLFQARRSYSPFFTCTTWAAQLLQAAGLPVQATGVVWPVQLMSQVHRLSALQRGG